MILFGWKSVGWGMVLNWWFFMGKSVHWVQVYCCRRFYFVFGGILLEFSWGGLFVEMMGGFRDGAGLYLLFAYLLQYGA